MFGLLNVNKPPGPTSHDVVARVRRLLPRRTKVGHTGTLDPFAGGVLVLAIGPATRLASCVADQPKQYRAEVTFAVTSTTDDPEGELTPTAARPPDEGELAGVLGEFVGRVDQVPPAHSAVHVDGRRAYELARDGKAIDLPARPVRIDAIELIGFADGRATLRVDCGKGTYIRSLARDLGRRLGCGAYCSALTRTRVGPFTLNNAVDPDALTADAFPGILLPAQLAVGDWPTVTLDPAAEAAIRAGQTIGAGDAHHPPRTRIAALTPTGRLIALCIADPAAGIIRPQKVFPA